VKCNFFPHFTALRANRNSDYLMGLLISKNLLFDKFRNSSIDDSAEQSKAVGVNPKRGNKIAEGRSN
jgi:hypothetical protein